MQLSQLQIRDFRNLVDVEFEPCAGANLFSGDNAAGKTSLLEAIYYLSHLRSFRTPNLADVINREANGLTVVAKALDRAQSPVPIGVVRGRNSLEVRANHKNIQRVADIAAILPVLAIHPDSYRLITGSPSERRAFLDWGVFHVEHGFFEAWQRYRKALSQRNAALKSSQSIRYCKLWDNELERWAEKIDALREAYLQELRLPLCRLIDVFFPGQTVEVEYRRGWDTGSTLMRVLAETFERDRRRGFTHAGPHRADLFIRVDGKSAQTGISRGQQKILVALLKLAQLEQFTIRSAKHCILLYDDLPAELDHAHRTKLLNVLQAMPVQVFLTAIEPDQIDLGGWRDARMFHVEHGRLR